MAIFFGNAHFPLPSSLVSTSTYHTVGQGLSFDGSLTQDGAGGFKFAGNAFQIDAAPTNIVPPACVSCSFMA